MVEWLPAWSRPALLVLLAAVPLVRRLHRRREARVERAVAALFLWPEAPAEAAADATGGRVDPRWRLRAAVAALLALGAAGPALVGRDAPAVEVLVDDGPSLAAREGDATRRDAAVAALAAALGAARPAAVRLVSLARPGRALDLDAGTPAGWRAAIDGWLVPAERRAPLVAPPPAPGHERWLATDGADAAVRAWAAGVPLHRVLHVGAATENVALTRLAARPALAAPGRHRGLARVTNGGTQAATRRLAVTGDGRPLVDATLVVPPGGSVTRAFDVPASVAALHARLETTTPAAVDGLAADDALALPLAALAPARVRVGASCGPHLVRALGAHPGLVRATGDADLVVGCDAAPPAGPAALWVRGAEEEAGDPSPVRETPGPPRRVEARLDLEAAERVGRAEYAALVNTLAERALGRPLLAPTAAVARPAEAAAVAPHPVRGAVAAPVAAGPGARHEGAPLLAAVAALLLLADAARRGTTPRRAAVRAALAAGALAAAWGPALPGGRAPLDAVVVLDDSASVDRGAADDAWRRVAATLAGLPDGGRLTVVRFAGEPVVEVDGLALGGAGAVLRGDPPRRLPLDRGRTDVGRALEAARARVAPGRRAAMVLLTDGVATDGDAGAALRALAAAGVPVVALPLARPPAADDAWIADVTAPRHARAGDVVPVAATVAAAAAGEAVVELAVDGTPRAARRVPLAPGRGTRVDFAVGMAQAGPRRLRVAVGRPGDPRPENDARERLVDVAGPPSVVYVGAPGAAPLATGLAAGGWDVERVAPAALGARLADGPPPGVVVLDDVAVGDAPRAAWEALDARVRRDGTGLLVLGGPRAFAAGDYRGSVLEALLPVTAEGRAPAARAAVLFLVDTSGSMERDRAGRRRLALAWRAVAAAARAVAAGDLVAVSTFAAEPAPLVPFGPAADAAARVAADPPAASGGTRLAPALEHARAALAGAAADERWLVVVTDGFVGGEDLDPPIRALAAAGVRVLALAIGADVDVAALERLTAAGGRILRTDDTAALPRLVARTVDRRDAGVRRGEAVPEPAAPLPFAAGGGAWPPVSAYAVTRARPDAAVHLATADGAPLLATRAAGVGRVAVLPAGLGGWAAAWTGWAGWPRFAGGLVGWLAGAAGDSRLDLRVEDAAAGLAVTADAVGADGEWLDAAEATLTVVAPGGRSRATPLAAVAPGRFAATVPATATGVHRIALAVRDPASHGGAPLPAAVGWALRTADREHLPGADALAEWRAAGLVAPWPAGDRPPALVPPRAAVPVGPWLALAVLAAWLAVLARELRGRDRAGRVRTARAA